MCLINLSQGPNPTEEGEGWKVFRESWYVLDTTGEQIGGGTVASPLRLFWFRFNQWVSDNRFEKINTEEDGLEYETGFHIFEKKEDAERYLASFSDQRHKVVKKVKFRNVTAKGPNHPVLYCEHDSDSGDYTVPCVVAKEIFVLDEETTECAS
jgi:hypothetical protein